MLCIGAAMVRRSGGGALFTVQYSMYPQLLRLKLEEDLLTVSHLCVCAACPHASLAARLALLARPPSL